MECYMYALAKSIHDILIHISVRILGAVLKYTEECKLCTAVV